MRCVMSTESLQVLVINPGSTSTRVGIFSTQGAELVGTIRHRDDELAGFDGKPVLDQLDFRATAIRDALQEAGKTDEPYDAVVGRGGLLPPTVCGTYRVDDTMIELLQRAQHGEHASNLGAVLANLFAQSRGVPAYIVDPVTVDEWPQIARFSGTPHIERYATGHALNIKAVARRFAKMQQREYASLRLIVIHMGSGITVSAHEDGRMVDNNTPEEGPFGPDRTGSLPVRMLLRHALSGMYTATELDRQVFGAGGIYAYLGTRDLREVERRIDAGEERAREVFAAMAYQIAKEAGAMAAVLKGNVDAVLLTGGMAHSKRLTEELRDSLQWIAPIHIFAGEDELQALADGAFRVLRGEELARSIHA